MKESDCLVCDSFRKTQGAVESDRQRAALKHADGSLIYCTACRRLPH